MIIFTETAESVMAALAGNIFPAEEDLEDWDGKIGKAVRK
jgi:hypothetical protein